jgi:hypothetical protein
MLRRVLRRNIVHCVGMWHHVSSFASCSESHNVRLVSEPLHNRVDFAHPREPTFVELITPP